MVHMDQGASIANICETLVTKYEFSQNSRKEKKKVGYTQMKQKCKTYSTKISTHFHGKQKCIAGSFKL